MRVVVTGATGNVATSVVRALAGDPAVTSVLGLARRRPELELAKTTLATADVADDPVLDADSVAALLDARPVPVPAGLLKAGAAATWRLRLQPVSPDWLDLALRSPLLDAGRARAELGWSPRHSATQALEELLAGLREGAGADTPPLDPDAGGPLRLGEFRTGVGGSDA